MAFLARLPGTLSLNGLFLLCSAQVDRNSHTSRPCWYSEREASCNYLCVCPRVDSVARITSLASTWSHFVCDIISSAVCKNTKSLQVGFKPCVVDLTCGWISVLPAVNFVLPMHNVIGIGSVIVALDHKRGKAL
jgi:hypothetical protein